MAKNREPTLRITLDFDQVMSDLLKVKPPDKAKPKKRTPAKKRGKRSAT